MKLENIDSNKILASCRYADGSKCKELFELYHLYDFEQFDKWNIVADLWGYTELPECLRNNNFQYKKKMLCAFGYSFLGEIVFSKSAMCSNDVYQRF